MCSLGRRHAGLKEALVNLVVAFLKLGLIVGKLVETHGFDGTDDVANL